MDHPTRRMNPNDPTLPNQDAAPRQDTCPRCAGRRVWARTQAHVHPLKIRKHDAGLFDSGTDCVPLVCISCGYTEFYTQNPQQLADES